jgi:hypothetical protein
VETVDSDWKNLYKAGGLAPLITLTFYLIQILAMVFGEPFPTTITDWFSLFQRNKVLGLLYLNALDIFSIAILGVMFLALYVALRRVNESFMSIAALLAFIGIAVFIAPRVAMLSVLPLSDQYAAATTEAQRATLLAAGEALNALGTATPETIGFLFMAVAGLIISLVILRGETFGKTTAYVGLLAGGVTFANHISVVMAPSIADILMPVNGLLWLVWWIMISRRLFQLGKAV